MPSLTIHLLRKGELSRSGLLWVHWRRTPYLEVVESELTASVVIYQTPRARQPARSSPVSTSKNEADLAFRLSAFVGNGLLT